MDRYRVIVLREGKAEDETLFELAGSASLLARLAPGALLEAMDEDGDARAVQQYDEGRATAAAAPSASVADRVFDSAVAAGDAAQAQGGDAPARRPRRTKAQIAADKEAVGLGYRDAAHRAEVEAQQQSGVTATTTFAGAAPVPPAAPTEVPSGYVPPAGEVVVGSVPGAVVTEQPGAAVAPPWNPFTS
jgi:hypothetical protein